ALLERIIPVCFVCPPLSAELHSCSVRLVIPFRHPAVLNNAAELLEHLICELAPSLTELRTQPPAFGVHTSSSRGGSVDGLTLLSVGESGASWAKSWRLVGLKHLYRTWENREGCGRVSGNVTCATTDQLLSIACQPQHLPSSLSAVTALRSGALHPLLSLARLNWRVSCLSRSLLPPCSYGDHVQHFKVLRGGGGQYFVWEEVFSSINQLVEFYKINSIAKEKAVYLRDGEHSFGKPRHAHALHDFNDPHVSHFHFLRGDVIDLLDCSDSQRWKGRCHGRVGYFPPEYVYPIYP
uniref:GRB2 related adaptor protein n=1 Tax=Scleropages formosus TaxID=113540 RepID=A0A8C9U270_SCLFO